MRCQPHYFMKIFIMLFMVCSPVFEACVEYQELKTTEFKTLELCKAQATKTLDQIIINFETNNIPATVIATCKEIEQWQVS